MGCTVASETCICTASVVSVELAVDLECLSLLCVSWLDFSVDPADSSRRELVACLSATVAALCVSAAAIFVAEAPRVEAARLEGATPDALPWVAFSGIVAVRPVVDAANSFAARLVEAAGWLSVVVATSIWMLPIALFVPASRPASNDCQFDLKLSGFAADEVDRLEAKALAHPVAVVIAVTFAPA